MENQIDHIYNVQLKLLIEYLKNMKQPYDASKVSFTVNVISEVDLSYRLEYQLTYLDYEVAGLLFVENGRIQTELCRQIQLGKLKITITRHDRDEEYQTSAYVSIQHLKTLWLERFHIWFEGDRWLPLVVTPKELRTYKVGREKEKSFLKVKEKR